MALSDIRYKGPLKGYKINSDWQMVKSGFFSSAAALIALKFVMALYLAQTWA